MTIRYQVVENPLREGTYFPRVVATETVPMSRIIETIVRETGISSTDVKAVLNALSQQIRLTLLDGDNVSIDGIGTFSVSLSEVLSDANAEVSDAVEVRVNLRTAAELATPVQDDSDFERVRLPARAPILEQFYDVGSKQENRYTAGDIGHITGEELNFDESIPEAGVFFIANDGTETRATSYSDVGGTRLAFLVPPGLAGEQIVEVRTYYNSSRLRIGRYRHPLTPA